MRPVLLTGTEHGFVTVQVPRRTRPIHVFEPATLRLMERPSGVVYPQPAILVPFTSQPPAGLRWGFQRRTESTFDFFADPTGYIHTFCYKLFVHLGATDDEWPIGTAQWLDFSAATTMRDVA